MSFMEGASCAMIIGCEKCTRLLWGQNIDEAVCISHSINTSGKGMNPTILLTAMEKKKGRLGTLALVWQPFWEKENSEFKPVNLRLKSDLVFHLIIRRVLVNIYITNNITNKRELVNLISCFFTILI